MRRGRKLLCLLLAWCLMVQTLCLPSYAAQTDGESDEIIMPSEETAAYSGEENTSASAADVPEDAAPFDVPEDMVQTEAAYMPLLEQEEALSKYLYLSELNPLSYSVGWGSLKTDVNVEGGQLSLMVSGQRICFYKGVAAHAGATLVYDLGADHGYEMFEAYMGIDASKGGQGNVKFSAYTSADNAAWETVQAPVEKTSADEAVHLQFSLEGVRYLKFVFDSNGANSYDHSCLCGAILYTGDYQAQQGDLPIKTAAELNEALAGASYTDLLGAKRMDVMRRALIERVGYDALVHSFFDSSKREERVEMMEWLWNDEAALTDFVTGGTPNGGSYLKSLMVLSELYGKYKADLTDATALYTTPDADMSNNRGRIYRTMMISIALTHDNGPYMWLATQYASDPLERYEAMKKVYTEGLMRNDVWENLNVEEMRYVMSNRIWNDEIYWINRYIRSTSTGNNLNFPNMYSPHRYLKYGKDWNNREKGLYDLTNYENIYDAKYSLTEWGVTPPENDNKLWMVFEGSHICWGISYVGTNFAGSFGVPSHYVRQPGHAAFFVYNRNSAGRTVWGIDNNISGWTQTWLQEDTAGNGNNRMMCDWGTRTQSWVSDNNATYIMLAATALDNLQDYEEAEILMSYLSACTTSAEKEALYLAVLDIMPYHLDAWKGLVDLYTAHKTAADCAALAKKLQAQMWYFPLPMHDLMTLLYNAVKNGGDENKATWMAAISTLEVQGLKKGSNANNDSAAKALLAQADVCVTEADYLQGAVSTELATFSFDGDTPGALRFGSSYAGVRFVYSLDGGKNWSVSHNTTSENLTYTFTKAELATINADDDILIWLEGWVGSNDNKPTAEGACRIDILNGNAVSGMECNDRENCFLGTVTGKEYSLDNGTSWENLTEGTTFMGKQTVLVRNRASGCRLAGAATEYHFAENSTDKYSYIPISRLSLDSYSSQETGRAQDQASHVIDGLLSTRWHTLWSGGDSARYVTVKLDRPTYVSGVDYTPIADAGNGTFRACEVYVSADGVNWALAGGAAGWAQNSEVKEIRFDKPVYGQYIRVCGTDTVNGYGAARELSFYEDTTFADKTMSGFTITAPAKTAYCVGEALNISGMTVTFCYSDASTVTMPASVLTPDKTVFRTEGEQTVTMQYGNYEPQTFSVTVEKRTFTPTALTVAQLPTCMTYLAGDTFDPSGMEVTVSDGTTTAYLRGGEYTWEADFSEAGEKAVTLRYGALQTTIPVTVKKAVQSISVVRLPDTLTYKLGENFDPTGLEVKVTYADGSEAALAETEYTFLSLEDFSSEDGNVTVTVALCDRLSITDTVDVKVYPYFTRGEISYELLRDENGQRVCYVTGIRSAESLVEVPAAVQVGTRTYSVVGVESGAMDGSSGVKAVALPGTIVEIASGAFTGCAGIEKVYLTQHSSFDGLRAAEDAFSVDTALVIYAADDERAEELAEKEFTRNLTVDNVTALMTGIAVTPPDKTDYIYGESLDTAGLQVYAVLADESRIPLTEAACRLEADMKTVGRQNVPVTVAVGSGEAAKTFRGSFAIRVSPVSLHITKNPVPAIYCQKTAAVKPLTVAAESTGAGDGFTYQWYCSEDGTVNEQRDLLAGATQSTYTPARSGYYYAKVSTSGSEVNSMLAYVDIGDYEARIGTHGYATLAAAVSAANSSDVVVLTRDITLADTVSVTRTVTVNGGGHTVKRGESFAGTFFKLTGSARLTIDCITLDGGARWTGEVNETLQRGTVNSGITAQAPLIQMANSSLVTLKAGAVLQNNCNYASASAYDTAGGIFACNTAGIVLEGATIQNCYSFLFGGAIYHRDNTTLLIRNATIRGNSGSTNWNTSAICVDNSATATVYGGTFCHNLGADKGGVFWVANGRLELLGGTYEANSAANGALVYLNGGAGLSIGACAVLQEVYLTEGKSVTVTADLGTATLPVRTASGNGTAAVKVASDELLQKAAAAVLVDGQTLVCSDGDLQKSTGSGRIAASILRDGQNLFFESFDRAVAAAQAEETITLYQNATLAPDTAIDRSLIVRTAGYTLGGITPEAGYLSGRLTKDGIEKLMVVHRGDLNGDGIGLYSGSETMGVLDLQALYDYLGSTQRPALYRCDDTAQDGEKLELFRAVADVNGDGAVNILDYQYYYEALLSE